MTITIGQRITSGQGDDRDTGTVDRIDGDQVTVRWDSGVKTTQRAAALNKARKGVASTAKLITREEQMASVVSCQYTAEEAAVKLGVSAATIRRMARKLGVRRISGPTVAGFIRFAASPVDVVLPYTA